MVELLERDTTEFAATASDDWVTWNELDAYGHELESWGDYTRNHNHVTTTHPEPGVTQTKDGIYERKLVRDVHDRLVEVHEGSNGFKVVSGPQLKKWRTPEERQSMVEAGVGSARAQAAAKKFETAEAADPSHGKAAGAANNLTFHQWKKDGE